VPDDAKPTTRSPFTWHRAVRAAQRFVAGTTYPASCRGRISPRALRQNHGSAPTDHVRNEAILVVISRPNTRPMSEIATRLLGLFLLAMRTSETKSPRPPRADVARMSRPAGALFVLLGVGGCLEAAPVDEGDRSLAADELRSHHPRPSRPRAKPQLEIPRISNPPTLGICPQASAGSVSRGRSRRSRRRPSGNYTEHTPFTQTPT
jgi:hypothetical protein